MFSAATKTGGAKAADVNYIDDVFSTWLYTGNGSTQTINNGIDLAGKGGMVWIKSRSAEEHFLVDTARGATKTLMSQSTAGEFTFNTVTQFNSNGFNAGTTVASNSPYATWTFRKQPKFFDVVTWTGNGVDGRAIAHNLGSVPGCIMVKKTSGSDPWIVYHRSLAAFNNLILNTDQQSLGVGGVYTPTSTTFTVSNASWSNENGSTYVAYLFAHDAGGFGAAGTDNVISCGSYTGTGAVGNTINLGYEPQFVIIKNASFSGGANWVMNDIMRRMSNTDYAFLNPNTADAETGGASGLLVPNATGFTLNASSSIYNASGETYIYIAIRRPMKPPTTGTEVFSPIISNSAQDTKLTTNFVVDGQLIGWRTNSVSTNWTMCDRLRGVSTNTSGGTFPRVITSATDAESNSGVVNGWDNTGFRTSGAYASINAWYANFRRAPGFFDIVCYTGNNVSGRTINHNLGVAPELMIVKQRSGTSNWSVYAAPRGATDVSYLNNTFEFFGDSGAWANTAPTSSVFTVGAGGDTNNGGSTFVAYLFASQAGVSKVGSYTGTGGTQTINCGFTGGARFVLIKRTDARFYSWFVWDTARGMVAGTDPRLALNSADAEVNNNWVYTATTGFQLVTNDAQVNANGGSYIYLAIA